MDLLPRADARWPRVAGSDGAVAVGSGAALADDPLLTARDVSPPAERQPLRVVFDRRGRLPAGSRLRAERDAPLLVTGEAPAAVLARLVADGITSLMLEGGPTLAGAFMAAGLIDRLALFVAPVVLGAGPGPVAGWEASALEAAPRAVHTTARTVGPDILIVAELQEV